MKNSGSEEFELADNTLIDDSIVSRQFGHFGSQLCTAHSNSNEKKRSEDLTSTFVIRLSVSYIIIYYVKCIFVYI